MFNKPWDPSLVKVQIRIGKSDLVIGDYFERFTTNRPPSLSLNDVWLETPW